MFRKSRRQFIEDSMWAAAAAAAATTPGLLYAEEQQSKSANEKLGVAVIGAKGRGGEHINAWAGRKDTEILYICDVDSDIGNNRAEGVEKRQGRKPKWEEDLRKVLEDKSVDIVSIATPNHLHSLQAIWAIQAGKDVYVEKPVSHNVFEGRKVVEAARKYNKICQTGTQSRSNPGMRAVIKAVHDGEIGELKVARGLCYKPRGSIGVRKEYPIPKNVNYDLWSGPAQILKLTRPQLHYDWHWVWPYGNGDLGNQGIHQMDLARWGLNSPQLCNGVISYGGRFGYVDAGDTANTQVVVHDYGDKSLVFEVRGLKTGDYKGSKIGVIFEGTEGYAVIPSYDSGTTFDKAGNKIKSYAGGADHFGNFLSAVRSRKVEELNADIEEGHLSSALCHLGNISYRLGDMLSKDECLERMKSIKTAENVSATMERFLSHLTDNNVDVAGDVVQTGTFMPFDPKAEKFIGNDKANAMLTRDYRAPFVVPSEV
jgi:predicted dehydrogenase